MSFSWILLSNYCYYYWVLLDRYFGYYWIVFLVDHLVKIRLELIEPQLVGASETFGLWTVQCQDRYPGYLDRIFS
jgi:hypothetical protein